MTITERARGKKLASFEGRIPPGVFKTLNEAVLLGMPEEEAVLVAQGCAAAREKTWLSRQQRQKATDVRCTDLEKKVTDLEKKVKRLEDLIEALNLHEVS